METSDSPKPKPQKRAVKAQPNKGTEASNPPMKPVKGAGVSSAPYKAPEGGPSVRTITGGAIRKDN